jgi:hypothetical protein
MFEVVEGAFEGASLRTRRSVVEGVRLKARGGCVEALRVRV